MDHKILGHRLLAVLAVLIMMQAQSCANLEDVETGYCGNHVVEPGVYEDCDGTPAEPSLCGARGTQHACRFIWEEKPAACPPGYVPSSDKRCRRPSGVYQLAKTLQAQGEDPQVADFEADGYPEVGLTSYDPNVGATSFSILSPYGDGLSPHTLPNAGRGALADLTADGMGDLSISYSNGLSVYRSRQGALDLKFYADESPYSIWYALLPSWLEIDFDGNDLALLGQLYYDGAVHLCLAECMVLGNSLTVEGVVVEYSEEDLLVSADKQPVILHLARSSLPASPPTFPPDPPPPPLFPPDPSTVAEIRLEGDATVIGGARLLDVTGDGLLDLVALGESSVSPALYVFPGPFPSPWTATDVLVRWLDLPAELDTSVGVFGELNGDGVADFAVGRDVFLSKSALDVGPLPLAADAYYRRTPWGRQGAVAVGDVNGDGLDDLVGQSDSSGKVQVLMGGALLPLVSADVADAQFLSQVGVVDFDGDGASDIVAALAPSWPDGNPRPCTDPDALVVAFGRAGGFPEAPSSLGLLAGTYQITAARLRSYDGLLDGFGDFTVAASCGDSGSTLKSAIVLGNQSRLLANPLKFDVMPGEPFSTDTVFVQDLVVAEKDSAGDHPDVVVTGYSYDVNGSPTYRGFVLPSWGDAELDATLRQELVIPSFSEQLAYGATGPAIDVVGTTQGLVVVTARNEIVDEAVQLWSDVSVQCTSDGCAPQTFAFQSATPLVNHGLAFVHAEVVDLDPSAEGPSDFAVVYGSATNVAFADGGVVGSDGMGAPEEELVAPEFSSALLVMSSATGYTPVQMGGFEEGDAPVEVVSGPDEIVVVGRFNLYSLDVPAGIVRLKFAGRMPTDARGAAVLDYNLDGLQDLFVVDGFSGHVLVQLPVNPTQAELDALVQQSTLEVAP